jgi:hypothetical protein
MGAGRLSEKLVLTKLRRHTRTDSNLYCHCCENLKSHIRCGLNFCFHHHCIITDDGGSKFLRKADIYVSTGLQWQNIREYQPSMPRTTKSCARYLTAEIYSASCLHGKCRLESLPGHRLP